MLNDNDRNILLSMKEVRVLIKPQRVRIKTFINEVMGAFV